MKEIENIYSRIYSRLFIQYSVNTSTHSISIHVILCKYIYSFDIYSFYNNFIMRFVSKSVGYKYISIGPRNMLKLAV